MASLHVSEFSSLGATQQGDSVPVVSAESHRADQVVALGASSTPSTNAFQSDSPQTTNPITQETTPAQLGTEWVLLTAGGPCSIAFGPGTPVAVVGGWFMASGSQLLVRVPRNQSWKVAAITDTA